MLQHGESAPAFASECDRSVAGGGYHARVLASSFLATVHLVDCYRTIKRHASRVVEPCSELIPGGVMHGALRLRSPPCWLPVASASACRRRRPPVMVQTPGNRRSGSIPAPRLPTG